MSFLEGDMEEVRTKSEIQRLIAGLDVTCINPSINYRHTILMTRLLAH